PPLGLVLEHSVELALDPLRDAGGVVHEAGDLVEEAVAGLSHGKPRLSSQVCICLSMAAPTRGQSPLTSPSVACEPVLLVARLTTTTMRPFDGRTAAGHAHHPHRLSNHCTETVTVNGNGTYTTPAGFTLPGTGAATGYLPVGRHLQRRQQQQ